MEAKKHQVKLNLQGYNVNDVLLRCTAIQPFPNKVEPGSLVILHEALSLVDEKLPRLT